MAKVSILNVPAYGHINPTLAVAQELVRRGENVTYFATEPFRRSIELTGATFRAYRNGEGFMPAGGPLPRPGGALSAQPYGLTGFLTWTLRSHIALLPEVLDALRADPPDYVIYGNLCHAGRFAAQILDRPAIAAFASLTQLSSFFQGRPPLPPPGPKASDGPPEYQQLQAELKDTYGIDLPEPFQLMRWPAALNIIFTSREFQPHAEQYDARYVFVGASIMERPGPVAFPFERLDGRPLIYISLGTIFNDRPDFYQLCMDAFDHGPWQVVMVLPGHIDATSLGTIPENFIVQTYVPQLELFPKVAVFITHGGMSSVQEALSFAVPLLVFPQMIEQTATAQRVTELGVGVTLSNDGLTSAGLREAVERIMTTGTFRQNSQTIRASLKAAGGFKRAADAIQAFVQNSGLNAPTAAS